jgi:polysaccharide biosynthesis protein PslH
MRAGGAARVLVAPNGTDPVDPLAPPVRSPSEPLRVLFVGSGDYWPNADGIAWVVEEVLPRVRPRMPVQFDVVGSPPLRPVAGDGVTYHGRVAELRPWYEAAHVVVAPLFLGSGTRLKVVEALAHGRPLVSTTVGAEGLGLQPGEHYLRADDPEAFAAALADVAARVAAGDEALRSMLAAGRRAVEPLLWPRIAARLAEEYLELLGGEARSLPAPSAAGPSPA